jgi:hypothetical protein
MLEPGDPAPGPVRAGAMAPGPIRLCICAKVCEGAKNRIAQTAAATVQRQNPPKPCPDMSDLFEINHGNFKPRTVSTAGTAAAAIEAGTTSMTSKRGQQIEAVLGLATKGFHHIPACGLLPASTRPIISVLRSFGAAPLR